MLQYVFTHYHPRLFLLLGVLIDVDEVESVGYFPYQDDNMGYPEEAVFEKSPAHEHIDSDGVIWSTVGMYQQDDQDPNILKTW